MSKRLIVVLAVVWTVVLVAAAASSLTLSICGISADGSGGTQERIIVSGQQYEIIERYERLEEIFDIVQSDYYTEVDEETLVTGAMRGMMNALEDPYTFYYTPDEMEASNEHQEGKYEGVGIQILGSAEGELIVTRAFRNSPAHKAGICAGDRIIAVEGEAVSAQSSQAMNDAVDKIKGEIGTEVRVTVSRNGVEMDFMLERQKVQINRVEYSLLADDIGYIMLYEFMGDDVSGFKDALKSLKKQGAKALIVDVRSNPGGLLDDVVEIADLLLPESLVVYIENRAGMRDSYYSGASSIDMPLAVLVNGMSASASEILAGAVQDTGVGIVVGEKTFGKGIVQTIIPFTTDGAGLQLTTATYYTPEGRSIHGTGITPDVEVDSEGYDFTISEPDPSNDPQLKAAVEALLEEMEHE